VQPPTNRLLKGHFTISFENQVVLVRMQDSVQLSVDI